MQNTETNESKPKDSELLRLNFQIASNTPANAPIVGIERKKPTPIINGIIKRNEMWPSASKTACVINGGINTSRTTPKKYRIYASRQSN
ncbi:hypothetical protein HUK80_11905 [Flavobacterium sp. MAH-1]|uniref:Uncharacterized protein n=1 Tax=Flavobacterium agri TaxID=2743471 RepID=A0A7Y9C6N7_9FLAO|nr:hypothetical protein [Flavobacterium agri]NUY81605.1 hypothetical protein [Flavobacterium agri]NYA71629.1 hypothetical protein [Flavobacterium agri]